MADTFFEESSSSLRQRRRQQRSTASDSIDGEETSEQRRTREEFLSGLLICKVRLIYLLMNHESSCPSFEGYLTIWNPISPSTTPCINPRG